MKDLIVNGAASGSVANLLMQHNFDPSALRPWVGNDGRAYIACNTGTFNSDGTPKMAAMVTNADATLRKDDWLQLDTAVLKVAKERLNIVSDLRSRGLIFSGTVYRFFSLGSVNVLSSDRETPEVPPP